MHDNVTNERTTRDTGLGTIKKANECVAREDRGPLFDEFWNDGELAVLFGPAGVGKSVLAVQVADALARGRPMDGFNMPEDRRRVLYVDMKLTEDQFGERYTFEKDYYSPAKRFRHSENLYIGCPHDTSQLCDYLREKIAEKHISVVVIDDASEFRSTYDGTRETLIVMRQLRRLQRELGISVLVIASSRQPGITGMVTENDLMRSRVLCETADSAFALGAHPTDRTWRYLMQIRSRSDALYWTGGQLPYCRMSKTDDGNLAFKFDDRFLPEYDEETRKLIVAIKHRHDEGASFRLIAEDLGIPVSRAHRLFKKWRPDLVRPEDIPVVEENDEEGTDSDSRDLDQKENVHAAPEGVAVPTSFVGTDGVVLDDEELDTKEIPPTPPRDTGSLDWPDWLDPKLTPEMYRGREILVESRDERGLPKVFYGLKPSGAVHRYVRDAWGTSGSAVYP